MVLFKADVPKGFDHPIANPKDAAEFQEWQEMNRRWWERNLLRYDWRTRISAAEFTPEFYRQIDHNFFSSAKEYMPWKKIPFDPLIDYDSLSQKDVLEIGVGSGCHAQLLASKARSFTGVDITEYAVKSTSERLRQLGLHAKIYCMQAEQLEFPDHSFDFVWSWGVIHHSSDIRKILQEIKRVLRPGGTVITMVYHRNFLNYYLLGGFFRGVLLGDLLKTKSVHKTIQRRTDGAIARYYSISEWRALASEYLTLDQILIFGSKAEIIPLPGGKFKEAVMALIPSSFSRLVTNQLKMGTFLVSHLTKKNS